MAQPNPIEKVNGGEQSTGADRPTGKSSRTAEPASVGNASSTGPQRGVFDKRDPYHMKNPRRLLALFSVLSLLSVVVILALVGYGIHEIYSSQMIKEAERDAAAVGAAILDQERDTLLAPGLRGEQRVALAEQNFGAFDARMRKFLRPFGIYKIKVFSRDKRVIYSTDRSIIGAVDSENVKLERVLTNGEVLSKLQSKDTMQDLRSERRFEADVVEAYLPIKVEDVIVGSFEVYIDVTRTRDKILKVVNLSITVLAFVLIAVFSGLYVPVRLGMLRLIEAEGKLHMQATVDPLTGTRNRRDLLARINEEHARMARRHQSPSAVDSLGLALVGVDDFKSIDDRFGEPAGDEILREVAGRLERDLHVYEVIGRYGNEEFLVLLPDTTLMQTKQAAERMLGAIRELPCNVAGTSTRVTGSAGIACLADPKDEIHAAIGRAEEGLRKARSAGGDRIAWI